MTDLDLDALEATARAVNTPGPWEARCDGYKEPSRVCHDSEAVIYLGYDYWADFMGGDAEHIAAFDPPTVLALIARLREAEQERDEARWAAGIVGDVARESSEAGKTQPAELHATQARLREAEAVIAKELSRHREKHGETPRFAPDDYQHELEPTHWEPYVICDACGTFWPCKTTQTLVYKPTNQEGN